MRHAPDADREGLVKRTAAAQWQYVGERPPTDLVDARLQLHWAAQLVAAVGTTLLPGAADDSHTNLEWLAPPSLLAGRLIPAAHRYRAALRCADLTLLLLDDRGGTIAEHNLHRFTMSQGMVWLEQEIVALAQRPLPTPLRRRELELPAHPVARGAAFGVSDAAACAELGRWYANADAVLRQLATRTAHASPVRCWPHHFDIATLVTLDRGADGGPVKTVGIGMSPGDASYAEPYWYVSPWPRPDPSQLPALDGEGEWRRTDWFGAVLTGSKIATQRTAAAQSQLVTAFVDSALAACDVLSHAADTPPRTYTGDHP